MERVGMGFVLPFFICCWVLWNAHLADPVQWSAGENGRYPDVVNFLPGNSSANTIYWVSGGGRDFDHVDGILHARRRRMGLRTPDATSLLLVLSIPLDHGLDGRVVPKTKLFITYLVVSFSEPHPPYPSKSFRLYGQKTGVRANMVYSLAVQASGQFTSSTVSRSWPQYST